jgi:hypothetical protein
MTIWGYHGYQSNEVAVVDMSVNCENEEKGVSICIFAKVRPDKSLDQKAGQAQIYGTSYS